MSENKKPFKKFKRTKPQTTEDKIKGFILRNSKNGFYTKVSTLSYKFEIPQEQAWDIVGTLLSEGMIESFHDEKTGEMKLCEAGKMYEILSQENKRKRLKTKEFRKNKPRRK